MREPPCEEPLRLRHLPLGGVAKDAVPKVSEASRKSRLRWRNCNSALPPPLLLLTFSGRKAKKKKKSWRVFVTKATAGSSSFFFPLFFACLPAFQFGTSPAVGVAEVAAQSYYVSSLRGSANDLGQRGGVALNLFQARPSESTASGSATSGSTTSVSPSLDSK